MRQSYRLILGILAAALCMASVPGCGNKEAEQTREEIGEDKIRIGLSFDSFIIERWQRDRDAFVARASGELGAEVNVQCANGDVEEQIAQIEYLIDKNMDVIVIVAVDSARLSEPVKKAKRAGVKVIAYDRLIMDADVDLYITFDNERVGEMMAETIIARTPEKGRIFMMCGSPEDNNVSLVMDGFHNMIDRTEREIVETAYADNWLAEIGFSRVSEFLDGGGEADAYMCGNDDIASQVIRVLSERRMAGDVCVVGQDADLGACQRVVEGTQAMTVYKPVEKLARRAAECAVTLAKTEDLKTAGTFFDGTQEVPYIGLEPIAVTAANMDTVIEDGFHLKEDIYLNIGNELTVTVQDAEDEIGVMVQFSE
ncbi:MAG: sugar ABC transporter substrate-binding protein [Lachnospiraceae bacterium]|jgi:D-xylose transport system substrate-binding protein|uniref:substrate-binding domain-containing protein n=1 Tax=Candidatus Merdisoma sp. JLR.KK006 TaxID=3112626 RepID=UPI002FF0ABBF|nr:sugar ABC transporter substrate-binding protein [Lachnospiraceae bacterium]